jgi:adenylate cyclase class 2
MTNYETEVKFHTPDLASMAARLEQAGGVLVKPRLFERNVRYENAEASLSGRGVVLRLRQDDGVRLTYKEPAPQAMAGLAHRLELETSVGDFDLMEAILAKLGYFPHVVYEKYRATYQLGAAEVVLDEMPYGNFIEIEGPAENIRQAIHDLGLSEAPPIVASYMDLFAQVKAVLGLTMPHLTFAAFQGLHIPPEIFSAR